MSDIFSLMQKNLLSSKAEDLNNIVSELRNYDILNFLSRLAALNLVPSNQNKSIIIDSIINAVLSHNSSFFNKSNVLSSGKFRNIVNRGMNLNISLQIDRAPAPFVQGIQFYVNHYIFTGITSNISFNLQTLLDVLFKCQNSFSKDFLCQCSKMAQYILDLSTNIYNQLGHDLYNQEPCKTRVIDIPDSSNLNHLANVLTINISDIENILGEASSTLYCEFGSSNHCESIYEDDFNFFLHPLLKINQSTAIILNPTILAPFLIHYIMKIAYENHLINDIVQAYNNYAWYKCLSFLKRLHHIKIDERALGIELINTPSQKEKLLAIGNDTLLFVRFYCDNAENYDFNKMFGTYNPNLTIDDKRWHYVKSKLPIAHNTKLYQLIIGNSFNRSYIISSFDGDPHKTLRLSPFELMCVSINESSHHNFIPRYIDCRSTIDFIGLQYSDIPVISAYTNNGYSFYFSDDVNLQDAGFLPCLDDSIQYIVKALQKEDRQLAEYPNSPVLREVVFNDSFRNIYVATDLSQWEFLIKFPNIDIWISTEPPSCVEIFNVKHSVLDLTSYWIGELRCIITNLDFKVKSLAIKMVFQELLEEYGFSKYKSSEPLSNFINIKYQDDAITIFWTPEAFVNICYEDNAREKELMTIIFSAILNFSSTEISPNIIDSLFENPLKKKMFALDYQTHPYFKPTIDRPRFIPSECEEQLLNEIGEYFSSTKGIPFGIITTIDKPTICSDIVDFLYRLLTTRLQQFNSDNLIKCIYQDLENVMYSTALTQTRYAFDISCYPEKKGEYERNFNEVNKSSLAMKFLIEYVTATPPSGTLPIGLLEYEYLLAICSLIIEWANSRDLFQYKIINNEISLLKSRRIGFDKATVNRLVDINYKASEYRLSATSNPLIQKYLPSDIINNLPSELDTAFLDEYNYTFTQFSSVITALLDIGDGIQPDIKIINKNELCTLVSELTTIDLSTSRKILTDISLMPRDDYLNPPAPFNKIDVYPWRFNRKLSFIRRPLIQYKDDIIWGNRQLYHSWLFLIDLILEGKFKAESKKLKSLVGTFADSRGDDFNDKVVSKLQEFNEFQVYPKVKKFNKLKVQSSDKNDLGDIDALIIIPETKKIIVAELKDFSFSKTPYEMYQQYLNVFCDNGKKLCYISKHKKRVNWIKDHIDDVLTRYNLPEGAWKVDDVLITNEIIISNEYYHKNQKILLYSDLTSATIMNL